MSTKTRLVDRDGTFVTMDVFRGDGEIGGAYVRLHCKTLAEAAVRAGLSPFLWHFANAEEASLQAVGKDDQEKLEELYQGLLKEETQ